MCVNWEVIGVITLLGLFLSSGALINCISEPRSGVCSIENNGDQW